MVFITGVWLGPGLRRDAAVADLLASQGQPSGIERRESRE